MQVSLLRPPGNQRRLTQLVHKCFKIAKVLQRGVITRVALWYDGSCYMRKLDGCHQEKARAAFAKTAD